jgi:hypothetical protein
MLRSGGVPAPNRNFLAFCDKMAAGRINGGEVMVDGEAGTEGYAAD